MILEMREKAGREVPVAVFGAAPENIEGYEKLGVERVPLSLETMSESETIKKLDELAGAVEAAG
jgi:hypothetical protein